MVKKMATPPLIAYIRKNLFMVKSGVRVIDSSLIENIKVSSITKVARGTAKVLEVMNIISLEARLTV